MKKLVLGLCLLTSISSFANEDLKICGKVNLISAESQIQNDGTSVELYTISIKNERKEAGTILSKGLFEVALSAKRDGRDVCLTSYNNQMQKILQFN